MSNPKLDGEKIAEFQKFANDQNSGYLKFWKAISMLVTIQRMPTLLADKDRLRAYVANCLRMEGFSEAGIDVITDEVVKMFHEETTDVDTEGTGTSARERDTGPGVP